MSNEARAVTEENLTWEKLKSKPEIITKRREGLRDARYQETQADTHYTHTQGNQIHHTQEGRTADPNTQDDLRKQAEHSDNKHRPSK